MVALWFNLCPLMQRVVGSNISSHFEYFEIHVRNYVTLP